MMVSFKYMAANAVLKLQYALNRNICQIHYMETIHCCKCSSKVNILFPAIEHSKFTKKKCFLGATTSDQSPFL